MILYLDTSALVKLFVDEPHSGSLRDHAAGCEIVLTHIIAYAEACAAFASISRSRRDEEFLGKLRASLDKQWERWEIGGIDWPLVRRAGELAHQHRLRAYDSIHLAAVERVRDALAEGTDLRFAVFDAELNRAAHEAGITLL